ncbi:MAG TPA: sulfotransferase [Candidatus Acidoferrales bacterium]|nr:sulfotransferase [Candidatus Acidoferrales bacterium]
MLRQVHAGEKSELRLPGILGIGPARTGTTWLDAVLRDHIGLPCDVKETQFFKWHYDKGMKWYAWHFRNCPAELPAMEICPSYFDSIPARNRIKEHIPDCRIICTLRDPVDRLYSVYRHYSGFSGFRSFEELIRVAPKLVECSDYIVHIREWFAQFGRENVLVAFYEDLEKSPQKFLDSICQFAGIPTFDLETTKAGSKKINAAVRKPPNWALGRAAGKCYGWLLSHRAYKVVNLAKKIRLWRLCFESGKEFGPPSPEIESGIRERLRPGIKALEELLGRDLSAWM